MITSDDVLTVLKEEAEEDVLRLAGVGNEEITDGILTKTKRRFTWLLLNLFTAIIASVALELFLSSSRILEKINTLASTAIPTVKTIPAIPGKVRVADKIDMIAVMRIRLKITAMLANKPKIL